MRYVFEKTIICGCIFHLLVRNLMYLLNRRSTHQTKERTQLLVVVLKNPTFSKIVVLRNRRLLQYNFGNFVFYAVIGGGLALGGKNWSRQENTLLSSISRI